MSIKDRAQSAARAEQAMRHLEANPATTAKQLGDAREVLNQVHTSADVAAVRDAVEGIETIVVEVYGGHP